MLQILDQRWREHLSDMDYLRDGIHLRQVAQQDPLTAWQKEGYLMFEHLLESVDIDYVRYITHVEATALEEAEADADAADEGLEGALTNVEPARPGRHRTAGAHDIVGRQRRRPRRSHTKARAQRSVLVRLQA